MAEVDGRVVVGLAASPAVLRVGRVGQRSPAEAVVVDAEVDGRRGVAAEVGDQRVVGVEDQACGRFGDDGCPPVGDRLELAVAVELVAKEVPQQDRPRVELICDLGDVELVDLEEADVGGGDAASAGLEQGRGDPAGHVRAGPVVDDVELGLLHHAGEHPRRRRLAVGRRDDHAPVVEVAGQPGDRPAVETEEDRAGDARPAAAPQAREAAGRPGERPLELEEHQPAGGTSTRTASATDLTSTGSSPIGSPSA